MEPAAGQVALATATAQAAPFAGTANASVISPWAKPVLPTASASPAFARMASAAAWPPVAPARPATAKEAVLRWRRVAYAPRRIPASLMAVAPRGERVLASEPPATASHANARWDSARTARANTARWKASRRAEKRASALRWSAAAAPASGSGGMKIRAAVAARPATRKSVGAGSANPRPSLLTRASALVDSASTEPAASVRPRRWVSAASDSGPAARPSHVAAVCAVTSASTSPARPEAQTSKSVAHPETSARPTTRTPLAAATAMRPASRHRPTDTTVSTMTASAAGCCATASAAAAPIAAKTASTARRKAALRCQRSPAPLVMLSAVPTCAASESPKRSISRTVRLS